MSKILEGTKRSIVWEIPSEKFSKIINESKSYVEVLKVLELSAYNGGGYRTLKKRIEAEGIDVSHFDGKQMAGWKPTIALEEILVKNSTYVSTSNLKKRLLRAGLLIEKCHSCGVGSEWNGKPLSLQLEHKNGICSDNRLENLCLLCPNCHSQTATYAGKNTKGKRNAPVRICKSCIKPICKNTKNNLCQECFKKTLRRAERPSKETLLQQIAELGYCGTARLYGVSDNAIRKWLKTS